MIRLSKVIASAEEAVDDAFAIFVEPVVEKPIAHGLRVALVDIGG